MSTADIHMVTHQDFLHLKKLVSLSGDLHFLSALQLCLIIRKVPASIFRQHYDHTTLKIVALSHVKCYGIITLD